MHTIYKYPIPLTDRTVIKLPAGATIIDVQAQGPDEQLYIWAIVDPTETELDEVAIYVFGTGHPDRDDILYHGSNDDNYYVGSVHLRGWALVFHVFCEWL